MCPLIRFNPPFFPSRRADSRCFTTRIAEERHSPTVGCRVIKSHAEIALLQRANDITLAAFKAAAATLKEGMTQYEFGGQVSAAFRALGSSGSALIGFGKYTAFPHGSIQPRKLKDGAKMFTQQSPSIDQPFG